LLALQAISELGKQVSIVRGVSTGPSAEDFTEPEKV